MWHGVASVLQAIKVSISMVRLLYTLLNTARWIEKLQYQESIRYNCKTNNIKFGILAYIEHPLFGVRSAMCVEADSFMYVIYHSAEPICHQSESIQPCTSLTNE